MDIYDYLKKDHRAVEKLIKDINAYDSTQDVNKIELFNKLKEEVLVHSKAEEKIFYSPLKEYADTQKLVSHAKKEHEEVEKAMKELSEGALNGAAWQQLFTSMSSDLQHHINEEENKLFEKAKMHISQPEANKMQEKMDNEKKTLYQTLDIEKKN